jgi:acetylornithine deacetylase/succinyl-diaminopimelate desuccinylase-like protein
VKDLEELFMTLLRFESPSSRDNSDLLEFVASEAEARGLAAELHRREGALTALHGDRGVLFSGHLDTVPLGSGWTRAQGERVGDRIYGRGSTDMKGGCAAALWAAGRLAARGIPCGVIFTTDEETGMRGARGLVGLPLLQGAAAIVVGEPTRNRVATEEKGVYWVRITTRGRPAHGSMTPLGENAITKMVQLLTILADMERPGDYLRETTANVGLISGGTAPNVVPPRCEASVDFRFPPSQDLKVLQGLVGKRLASVGVAYDLEVIQTLPAVGVDPESPHVQALLEAGGGEPTVMTYATEMAVFHAVNPRTVILGPGEPTLAHTVDEHVEWGEVVEAARIYEAYGEALART